GGAPISASCPGPARGVSVRRPERGSGAARIRIRFVVAGESFAPPTGPGPELTGMGSHHPAEYFLESILTPDAVLVDGPEYVGPDEHLVLRRPPLYRVATLSAP